MHDIELSADLLHVLSLRGLARWDETEGVYFLTDEGSAVIQDYCRRALDAHSADLARLDTDYDPPAAKRDQDV